MKINININRDGIWGDTELDGIDVKGSENKLTELVAEVVRAEYECEVEVEMGDSGKTKITIDPESFGDTKEENVEEIISTVWGDWQWIVESN